MIDILTQQTCPYCQHGEDITEDKKTGVSINGNKLLIFYDSGMVADEVASINYCPMCGRCL